MKKTCHRSETTNMISSRDRRLITDFQKICVLNKSSSLIDIQSTDLTKERYTVTYSCKGIMKVENKTEPIFANNHKMEIYLHKLYPRRPPQLKWVTDIFHPNILSGSQNGGVCIGGWTPAETLDKLIIRIGEMVQYKSYNIQDVLNLEASEWVILNKDKLPVDKARILNPVKIEI